MGNQQGTVSEGEIAWLAGIIEGEGTLMLSAWASRADKTQRKLATTIVIYNTDAFIIKKCVDIIRRIGMEPYLKEKMIRGFLRDDGSRSPESPVTSIRIDRFGDSLILLKTIRPWLFGSKSARADLMMQFLEKRLAKMAMTKDHFKMKYSEDEVEIVKKFYLLCKHPRANTNTFKLDSSTSMSSPREKA